MNYGYIIKRAWEIIWKQKILFVFGVIASSSVIISQLYIILFQTPSPYSQVLNMEANQFDFEFIELVPFYAGLLFISLILGFVITTGTTGINLGTFSVEKDEPELTFKDLFQKTKPFILRVYALKYLIPFFLSFVPIVLFFGMFLLIGVENFELVIFLCICGFSCVYLVLFWGVGIVVLMANLSLIENDSTVFEAVKTGWNIFKKNLGVFILFSFAGFVFVIIIGSLLLVPLSFVFGIAGFSLMILSDSLMISTLFSLIYSLGMWIINSFIQTYFQSFWTLFYLEIKKIDTVVEELEPETV